MIDISAYSATVQLLALCRYSGVAPRLFEVLLRRFNTVAGIILAEETEIAAIDGISAKVARRVSNASRKLEEARRYVADLSQREILMVNRFEKPFPELLFELNDPPPLLYFRGRLPDAARKTVALIGTTRASTEGIEMTSRLAREFAASGVQVISSLKGGIDSAAHLACITAGGTSYAVVDCGVDHLPQKEGIPLAIDIVKAGGVIGEYAPDIKADNTTMLQTNRLLSGLGQAVVVTEVYKDSNRTLDLLKACHEIGKLAFFMIDPEHGAFSDETALAKAMEYGVIPLEGYERIGDIIKVLV